MNTPKKLYVGPYPISKSEDDLLSPNVYAFARAVKLGETDIPYIRADIVGELVEALDCFPGFTDDAVIGDSWLEIMRAALAKAKEVKDE